MKKLIAFICIFVVMFNLAGCKTQIEKFDDHISEIRDNCFEGESDRYSISAISGKREENFNIDGKTNKKINYLLITLIPKDKQACVYKYSVKLGEKSFNGNFNKHPYNNSYCAEIKIHYTYDFTLTITDNENKSEDVVVKRIKQENEINGDYALEIAMNKLKFNKDIHEIFIRKIKNPINDKGGYYWYVAFCSADKKVNAVLLDIIDGKVIAIRED